METLRITDNLAVMNSFSSAIGDDYKTLESIMYKCKTPGEYEVEFKVNGVEVPYSRFINRLYDNFEKHVEFAAIELQEKSADSLQDIFTDFENKLTELYEKFREKKNEIIKTI